MKGTLMVCTVESLNGLNRGTEGWRSNCGMWTPWNESRKGEREAMGTMAGRPGLSRRPQRKPRWLGTLLNGQLYINVHTAQNPDGEIRGNLVVAVPEPSPLA